MRLLDIRQERLIAVIDGGSILAIRSQQLPKNVPLRRLISA